MPNPISHDRAIIVTPTAPAPVPSLTSSDAVPAAVLAGLRTPWYRTASARDRVLGVIAPFLLLLVWEALSRTGVLDDRFFPAPSQIAATFGEMIGDGTLLSAIGASGERLIYGFVLGAVPGVLIGVAMGMSWVVRALVDPIIAALMPVPKTAIIPLSLLIFGMGESSKVAMVAIGVFFPVAINAYAGVAGVQRIYFDVAKNLGASRRTVFTTIAWPGALPTVFAGFQLAVANALIVLTVVEMLAARTGVGSLIWTSWQVFEVERMYVGIITISAAGVVIQLLMNELKRHMLRWDPR